MITPVLNRAMNSPKAAIVAFALGLTVLIWGIAVAMILSLSDSTISTESRVGEPVPAGTTAVVSRNPGLSLQMFINIRHLAVERRKYLFDFGNANRERLSIYLSSTNVFTVALVDAESEPHFLQVPLGQGGIPMGKPICLACEAGVSSSSTSLRLLVNARPVGSVSLPFRVNLGALNVDGGVVGADLEGGNGGSFDLYELAVYSATLADEDIAKFAEYFKRPKSGMVAFRGTQWMRVGAFQKP